MTASIELGVHWASALRRKRRQGISSSRACRYSSSVMDFP